MERPVGAIISLLLPTVLAACSANDDDAVFGAGKEDDGAGDVLSACATGISLPAVHVDGAVIEHPVPPQPHTGLPLEDVDMRSLMPADLDTFASVDGNGALTRRGWVFEAHQGEQFQLQQIDCGVVRLTVQIFGPIATDCSAPEAPAPVRGATIVGPRWTAPATGVYLMSPSFGSTRNFDGTFAVSGVMPHYSCNDDVAYGLRRLERDGAPAAHGFVEAASWPAAKHLLYTVDDAAITRLDGHTAIVAIGSLQASSSPGTGVPSYHPGLVVARPGALDAPVTALACSASLGGRIVVADLDEDGHDDILDGGSLFTGRADGTFACVPSGLPPLYSYEVYGAIDLDHDGRLDLVAVRVQPDGSTSDPSTYIYVQPFYRRGAGFVGGAFRVARPRIAAFFPDQSSRGDLADVDGDGVPEIVVGLRGPTAASASSVESHAYRLPSLDARDATPGSDVLIPLDEVQGALPPITSLGRKGPRELDLDGDGQLDRIVASRLYWSMEGFGFVYGRDDGRPSLPWQVVARDQGGNDRPSLDAGDLDGDGCPDVLVGGAGLTLFTGVHCR